MSFSFDQLKHFRIQLAAMKVDNPLATIQKVGARGRYPREAGMSCLIDVTKESQDSVAK